MPSAKIINGVLLLNPGSPTDKRFSTENTVFILKIDKTSYKYEFIQILPHMI